MLQLEGSQFQIVTNVEVYAFGNLGCLVSW